MKRAIALTWIALAAFAAVPAQAKLRTLGTVESVGLIDSNPDHFAIVLAGCEWEAVETLDGGHTWRIVKKKELPVPLLPLPASGEVCYREVGYRGVEKGLTGSRDGGKSWNWVTPWNFLYQRIHMDVEREKGLFMRRFGVWLLAWLWENRDAWLNTFAVSALCLLAAVSVLQARRRRPWALVTLLSACGYVFVGVALAAICQHYTRLMCFEQWEWRHAHWDNGIACPHWPLGILLHLSGNPLLAPLAVLATFPLTPLFHVFAQDHRFMQGKVRWLLITGACLFVLFIPLAMRFGVDWDWIPE